MGQVGLEWQVLGFGDFTGNANETDMLMQNTNTGAFEVYDIRNNQIVSAASMGQVGLQWTVAGFADFSGNANETDMLMRNSGSGVFELYDIRNTVTSARDRFGRKRMAGRRRGCRSAAWVIERGCEHGAERANRRSGRRQFDQPADSGHGFDCRAGRHVKRNCAARTIADAGRRYSCDNDAE